MNRNWFRRPQAARASYNGFLALQQRAAEETQTIFI